MNYFELFGLSEKFAVDTPQLTQVYKSLLKAVHPDRFAHSSGQEQLLAAQKAATVNDAYQTLKNPLKRAEYILMLRNTDMPSEQSSFSDTSFLMRQMELREMLAEIKLADDIDTAVIEATQILESEFEQLFKQMQLELAEASELGNKKACESLRKLKFYQKLHVELDKLEDLLFED